MALSSLILVGFFVRSEILFSEGRDSMRFCVFITTLTVQIFCVRIFWSCHGLGSIGDLLKVLIGD